MKECKAAKFIPVVEQIKEAAKYQIQVDLYEVAMLQRSIEDDGIHKTWRVFSEGFELFLSSFIKAVEEDTNFDSEISNFLSFIIEFLEDFDLGEKRKNKRYDTITVDNSLPTLIPTTQTPLEIEVDPMEMKSEPGSWIMNDIFRDMMMRPSGSKHSNMGTSLDQQQQHQQEQHPLVESNSRAIQEYYNKIYAFLRTITRTIAIARSSSSDKPNFKVSRRLERKSFARIVNRFTLTIVLECFILMMCLSCLDGSFNYTRNIAFY